MDSVDKNALSPYAPIRWRDELWWNYGKLAAKDGLVRADGRIASTLPGLIKDNLIEAMMAGASKWLATLAPEDRGVVAGQMLAKFMEQRHWVPLIGQYEANGRQIFDLHDGLTEALLQTDMGECTLEDLALPYDCFFLSFGKQQEIKVPWEDDFEYADGAFVAATPWDEAEPTKRRYKIGLSTVKKDGSGVMMPGYFIDFIPAEASLPVQQAIDAAIERRKRAFFEGVMPGSQDEVLAQHRTSELEEGAILARKALALVFNAMFYLESLNDIPSPTPGRDTSPGLVAKWAATKPERRHKLQSELTASGYTMVHLLGSEVADALAKAGGRPDGVRTHWRRGHYKQQPYGPGQSLRRRQWIRPTIVNAHKSEQGDELPGHIYVSGGNKAH